MAKPDPERVFRESPALDRAWQDYGFNANIRRNIVAAKVATLGHYYVAFLVRIDDHYEVIDLAGHTRGEHWAVQNDGSSDVTPAQFRKMHIPSGCDWLEGWPED